MCFEIIYLCSFEVEEEIDRNAKPDFLLKHIFQTTTKNILRHKMAKSVVEPCVSLLYALSLNPSRARLLKNFITLDHFRTFFEVFPFGDEIFVEIIGLLNMVLSSSESSSQHKLLPDLSSVSWLIEKIESIVVLLEVNDGDEGEQELFSHAIPVLELLRSKQAKLATDNGNGNGNNNNSFDGAKNDFLYNDNDNDNDNDLSDDENETSYDSLQMSSLQLQQKQQYIQQLQSKKNIKKHTHKKFTQTQTTGSDMELLNSKILYLQNKLLASEAKQHASNEKLLMANEEVHANRSILREIRFQQAEAVAAKTRAKNLYNRNPWNKVSTHSAPTTTKPQTLDELVANEVSNHTIANTNDMKTNINNNKEFAWQIAKTFLKEEAKKLPAAYNILEQFADAVEKTFLSLLLATNSNTTNIFGVLPSGYCRKYFSGDLKLSCLAEADLQITKVCKLSKKTKGGVDFEAFCKILFTLNLVKYR